MYFMHLSKQSFSLLVTDIESNYMHFGKHNFVNLVVAALIIHAPCYFYAF